MSFDTILGQLPENPISLIVLGFLLFLTGAYFTWYAIERGSFWLFLFGILLMAAVFLSLIHAMPAPADSTLIPRQ